MGGAWNSDLEEMQRYLVIKEVSFESQKIN